MHTRPLHRPAGVSAHAAFLPTTAQLYPHAANPSLATTHSGRFNEPNAEQSRPTPGSKQVLPFSAHTPNCVFAHATPRLPLVHEKPQVTPPSCETQVGSGTSALFTAYATGGGSKQVIAPPCTTHLPFGVWAQATFSPSRLQS